MENEKQKETKEEKSDKSETSQSDKPEQKQTGKTEPKGDTPETSEKSEQTHEVGNDLDKVEKPKSNENADIFAQAKELNTKLDTLLSMLEEVVAPQVEDKEIPAKDANKKQKSKDDLSDFEELLK